MDSSEDSGGDPGSVRTGADVVRGRRGTHNDSHPWGRRQQVGYLQGFVETARQIIVNPVSFFRKVDPESQIGGDLLYAIFFSLVASIPTALVQAFWQGTQIMMGLPEQLPVEALGQTLILILFVLASIVLAPIGTFIGIFISAGLVHLVLLLFDWAKRPFGATVKTLCYTQTTQIVIWVPLCGGLLSLVWGMVVEIIGLRELHEISTGQAVLSAFAPLLFFVLCICSVILFFTGMSLGISSLQMLQAG